MKYQLKKAQSEDLSRLIEYKWSTIFEYAKDEEEKELEKMKNYVYQNVGKQLEDYQLIIVDDKKIGCLLVKELDKDVLLDEIYIEKEYRGKKIGSSILLTLITKYPIISLWVYKENKRAFDLYKKLGFKIIEQTDTRYFMRRIDESVRKSL